MVRVWLSAVRLAGTIGMIIFEFITRKAMAVDG